MPETISIENHFVASHKDTGDTKHHPHKYIVELEAKYAVAATNIVDVLDDVLIVILHDLDGADLNELFERDTRCSFQAPSLVNITRYILFRVKDGLHPIPLSLQLVITEINDATNSQRAVKMRLRS